MNTQTLFRLSHILVKSNNLAQDVKQHLQEGQHFDELAIEYSACPSSHYRGDLGWMLIGELPKCLQHRLSKMAINQWEGPILSGFGYHFIKLIRKSHYGDKFNDGDKFNVSSHIPCNPS